MRNILLIFALFLYNLAFSQGDSIPVVNARTGVVTFVDTAKTGASGGGSALPSGTTGDILVNVSGSTWGAQPQSSLQAGVNYWTLVTASRIRYNGERVGIGANSTSPRILGLDLTGGVIMNWSAGYIPHVDGALQFGATNAWSTSGMAGNGIYTAGGYTAQGDAVSGTGLFVNYSGDGWYFLDGTLTGTSARKFRFLRNGQAWFHSHTGALDGLAYFSPTGQMLRSSIDPISLVTTSAPPQAGQVGFFTSSTQLAGSQSFFYNNSNNRLRLNLNVAAENTLDIVGAVNLRYGQTANFAGTAGLLIGAIPGTIPSTSDGYLGFASGYNSTLDLTGGTFIWGRGAGQGWVFEDNGIKQHWFKENGRYTPANCIGTGDRLAYFTDADELSTFNINPANIIISTSNAGGDISGNFSNLQIGAATVGTSEISNDAVTSAKIPFGAIGSSELAANSVTTTAVADASITPVKINTTGSTNGQVLKSIAGVAVWSNDSIGTIRNDTLLKFESAGTATWAIPAGAEYIDVFIQGAGGGGASGRKGAPGTIRCGGGAGAGGGTTIMSLKVSDLGASSLFYQVGAGGAGGAARTIDDSNGANGSAGGETFLALTSSSDKIARAPGGNGGSGGTASSGSGGSAIAGLNYSASSGASASTLGGAGSSAISNNTTAVIGGGSGGGIDATNTASVGGSGNGPYGSLYTGSNGGEIGANGTSASAHNRGTFSAIAAGGGGSSVSAIAGNGGNGVHGSGGGGGGASQNGSGDSGAGGAGGDGRIWIYVKY